MRLENIPEAIAFVLFGKGKATVDLINNTKYPRPTFYSYSYELDSKFIVLLIDFAGRPVDAAGREAETKGVPHATKEDHPRRLRFG